MSETTLVLGMIITWRLTSLLVHEAGPFGIFERLRDAIGVEYDQRSRCIGSNEVASAFCCVWCLSIWVGAAVAAAQQLPIALAFAYSAGAIIVEQWVRKHG